MQQPDDEKQAGAVQPSKADNANAEDQDQGNLDEKLKEPISDEEMEAEQKLHEAATERD
jgi:hypothetical protein